VTALKEEALAAREAASKAAEEEVEIG